MTINAIDASVHPILGDDELRRRIGQPWRSGKLPHVFGTRYQPPFAEVVTQGDAAGDPVATAQVLFVEHGVDAAIVTPLTRGLLPNPQQAAALAGATNQWVAECFLDCPESQRRYFGSIRIPVTDVAAALTEIETWADDRRFVQIAVPLRAFLPYGDDFYMPIWRAASELDMPVCMYDDFSNVVEHPETPVGPARYFAERHVLKPMAAMIQVCSLITSGTFDRLPGLKFIIGDGGVDFAHPLFWRVDGDWRQSRVEVPWVKTLPSLYLADHIRFISQPEDGRHDGHHVDADLLRISGYRRLVLFGSRYPHWDYRMASTAFAGWPEEYRGWVMAGNALETIPRLVEHMSTVGTARAVDGSGAD